MKIIVGKSSILKKVPKLIKLEGNPYILAKNSDNSPILYSAICPHQHNVVEELNETIWRCPSHGWTFDPTSGDSISPPNAHLQKIPIKTENGFIYAEIPKRKKKNRIFNTYGEKTAPKITLVGSSSLLIEWKNFNILTDPWIEGLAVCGAWINYPPSGITISELPRIDAIWISHEHSDHFHEYTLSKLNKNIPVYVPDFDNNRLGKRAEKLGFKNVIAMKPGKIFNINNNIKAITFSSGSIWNDHILFLQLGLFKILNINDAGFNWTIKDTVGKIDMICTQFSPGSGYPATWTHLDLKNKQKLMRARNLGILKMIKQISTFCQADYILPFANFNELYRPEHLKYVKMQPKNRLTDVIHFFKNSTIKVIDLLPGESWDGKTGKFTRKSNRNKFYQRKTKLDYLRHIFKKEKHNPIIPKRFDIDHSDLKKYFEEFHYSDLARQVGKYSVAFTAKTHQRELHSLIKFENGKIIYQPSILPQKAELTMICPGNFVQEIIQKDLSWDEISSGYWCTFSRNPDVYNVAFWKLLHVPWKARSFSKTSTNFIIKPTTAIADIIERGGNKTLQVFEEFGLYCAGCQASIGENIKDGCTLHGLNEEQTKKLIIELDKTITNQL